MYLDWVGPECVERGLVPRPRELVQEVSAGHLGVVWDEDLGEVDGEPRTPHGQPPDLADVHRGLRS